MDRVAAHFGVYDLIGHVVPGVIAMLLVAPLLPESWVQRIPELSEITLIIVGFFIAYGTGLVLSSLASPIDKLMSKLFGWPGDNLLKLQPQLAEALRSKISRLSGIPAANVAATGIFALSWALLNEQGRSDRAGRLYALAMFYRSLAMALAGASIAYVSIAAFSSSNSGYYIAAVVMGLVAIPVFARARSFVNYYAKDVLTRAVILQGGEND